MYFIKKITIDELSLYRSSEIVDHTNKTISTAILLLEKSVQTFVKEEYGRITGEKIKIIDIHSISQVNEPLIDTILLYRLEGNPHRIMVYQKKTVIEKVKGWWGENDTPIYHFRLIHYFELEEYNKMNYITQTSHNGQIETQYEIKEEMVHVGQTGLQIPKRITSAPICNVLDELKNSPKFVVLRDSFNDSSTQYSKGNNIYTGHSGWYHRKLISHDLASTDVVINDPITKCNNIPPPPPPMLMPRLSRKMKGTVETEKDTIETEKDTIETEKDSVETESAVKSLSIVEIETDAHEDDVKNELESLTKNDSQYVISDDTIFSKNDIEEVYERHKNILISLAQ